MCGGDNDERSVHIFFPVFSNRRHNNGEEFVLHTLLP